MPRRSYVRTSEAASRSAGGRPPKFREPRKPITVTLPLRTLELLSAVDGDRARAIVKLADSTMGSGDATKPVEVLSIGGDAEVLVVGPTKALGKIPWVRRLEIAPARYLISIEPGTPIDSLEVALVDLLDELGGADGHDRKIVEELLGHVRRRRRDQTMTKEEILVIRRGRPKRRR